MQYESTYYAYTYKLWFKMTRIWRVRVPSIVRAIAMLPHTFDHTVHDTRKTNLLGQFILVCNFQDLNRLHRNILCKLNSIFTFILHDERTLSCLNMKSRSKAIGCCSMKNTTCKFHSLVTNVFQKGSQCVLNYIKSELWSMFSLCFKR